MVKPRPSTVVRNCPHIQRHQGQPLNHKDNQQNCS
jgi:hypothetical protein